MTNPYVGLPEDRFWKTGVFAAQRTGLAPVVAKRFTLARGQKVATAGSCFAQNVALHLRAKPGIDFLTAEPLAKGDPVFSARYGNIYTAHQLLQLLREAVSGEADLNCAVRREDGRFVDIHRPFIAPEGFATPEETRDERRSHLAAVRRVFEEADLLIFTLGLTEAWRDPGDGRVFPVCPGVYCAEGAAAYEFINYDYEEIRDAMKHFVNEVRALNPKMRILLTVSPVPLTATYTDDHVLVATMHSKSILRAVAGTLATSLEEVYYFPSYEMIAEPFTEGSAYDPENLRTVRADAVARVMALFDRDYLAPAVTARPAAALGGPDEDVVCDDVEIERSVGF